MLKIITWNIQSGRAPGGKVDLGRIIDCLNRFSDFDILCLQEVSAGFPARDGGAGGDQFAELAALLPGYTAASALAVDTLAPDGGRQRQGTMIFSRHPVLQVLRHSLPWPADPEVMSIPRIALEATIDTPDGLLRVTSAHLEYFSLRQRRAQVDQLRALHREAIAHAAASRPGGPDAGPFAAVPRAAAGVLLGDFNMLPGSPEYMELVAPFADGAASYRDAWQQAHPGQPHGPTVGLHDRSPGAGEPFAFDYAFVTADLAGRVRQVRVDDSEQGSDHQAMLLELD